MVWWLPETGSGYRSKSLRRLVMKWLADPIRRPTSRAYLDDQTAEAASATLNPDLAGPRRLHPQRHRQPSDARLGVVVYINDRGAKLRFEQLRQQLEPIETKRGCALEWQELPDAHACCIALCRPDSLLENETRWPEYIAWMIDQTTRMPDVFRPVIRALP